MKHLKVKAKTHANSDHFHIWIEEQTHREDSFAGGQEEITSVINRPYIFVHGSIMLISLAGAARFSIGSKVEWGVPERYNKLLYITEGADRATKIPIQYWGEVKAAIEAYNEYYKDK